MCTESTKSAQGNVLFGTFVSKSALFYSQNIRTQTAGEQLEKFQPLFVTCKLEQKGTKIAPFLVPEPVPLSI